MRENFEPNWPGDEAEQTPGAWIRIPAPLPVLKSETLWHYTNTAGLIGIVQSDRLWATAVSMLNDSTELRYGLEKAATTYRSFIDDRPLHPQQSRFLAEVSYEVKDSLRTNSVYAVCASRDGDDLGQWRGYAEGSGYAIGLKATSLSGVCGEDHEPTEWQNRDLHTTWQTVLYEPEEQDKLLTELWEFSAMVTPPLETQPESPEWNVMRDTAASALTNAVALMKHPGFRGEQEVRFVLDAARHPELLRFRPGPNGVTPFVELGVMPEQAPQYLITTHSPDRLRIDQIRIGPAQDQQTAELGLRTLCNAIKRKRLPITHSAVPYR